ncbi:C-4 sterol methyl oxidase [Kickxella alabastrina]|uniref:C-4 sterol methyl oxidase n=1 Tax=Kickxella alabastrina TaxID=61397 RepID=A0ACC1I4F9_9FUNG|nr:C-4 sterol methyl oxidase [Kickxella alabastrina]
MSNNTSTAMETVKVLLQQFVTEVKTVGNQDRLIPAGYTPTWAERTWFSLFQGQNEAIVFGIISFIIHQAFYYGRYLPYCIFDRMPSMAKYKLQPDKHITDAQWWKCVNSLLASQIFVQLPMMMFFLPAAKMVGFDCAAPFPAWQRVVFQVCVFFIFEDFYHYWAHRLFHYGVFYKSIHKVHHEHTAPFGIAAEYAHPIETAVLGQGTIAGPLLFNFFIEQVHTTTMLIWIAARLCQTVEAHCGYDFPWSMSRWLPFWAGASHHDYHHMAFVDNFASTFRWWDSLFGTDRRYQAYEARRTGKVKAE